MIEEKKPKILLAEDDESVREYIKRLLTKNGYDVAEAVDGKEAIALYEKRELVFDAIVSDLLMPAVDGRKLAQYNFENRILPFIVCTAVADAKTALELLKFGVHDYVVKPIERKHFLAVVKNAISRHTSQVGTGQLSPYDGNVVEISLLSRTGELQRAIGWIKGKVGGALGKGETGKFINFVSEFLLNAHEHGNLGIGREEKAALLEEEKFDIEVKNREAESNKKIGVAVSVLKDEVAVKISDDGAGFDYDKQLAMSDDDLLAMLTMPSGRGVYMGSRYFDRVQYSDGGSTVLVTKSIVPATAEPLAHL